VKPDVAVSPAGDIGAIVSFDRVVDRAHFDRWAHTLVANSASMATWSAEYVALAGPAPRLVASTTQSAPRTRARIAADARLDARDGLIRKLVAHGRPATPASSDAELILTAYDVWGVACTSRLIGDFAFLIWDPIQQHLFAARDQFGVRPLYYTTGSDVLAVSTSPNALFAHPSTSRSLDDQAVVDFLVHDDAEEGATMFSAIRRLPAAHSLVRDKRGTIVSRYWSLEPVPRLSARAVRGIPEEFDALMTAAVSERMRGGNAGVLMSGGLDSTAVAAFAVQVAGAARVRAYTAVSGRMMPELEQSYAESVRSHLGIGGELHDIDAYVPLHSSATVQLWRPVPNATTIGATAVDLIARAGSTGGVVLTGLGPDGSLLPEPLPELMRRRPVEAIRFGFAAAAHTLRFGRHPPMGLSRKRLRSESTQPPWLGREAMRWFRPVIPKQQIQWPRMERARAQSVMAAGWASVLETYSAAARASGACVSHPFLDLRVVRLCLALPSIPWCWDKRLLRESLSGALPREVVMRAKTPMPAPWLQVAARESDLGVLAHMSPGEGTRKYFEAPTFAELQRLIPVDAYTHLRPVALDLFLAQWNAQPVVW
jgi:asparagine synthase (glutamine-hydrolysing)